MLNQNEASVKKERIDFLCFDLGTLSRTRQFISLTTLTFVFFVLYGYLYELLFRLPGFGDFSWFLCLVQFSFYTLFAFIESVVRNERQRKIPLNAYLILGLLTVATMGFAAQSMPYLNFPTQLMFKSCKLILVLLGGVVIQGKKFNVYDISATLMMTLGLIFFTLADAQVQPSFNLIGVMFISCSLAADAAIGNYQEQQMKVHKASNVEVV
jgi:adenosine 3'-phospho 5'-phosphosulfate transporter B3